MSRINVSRVHRNPRFWAADPLIIERSEGAGQYRDGIWEQEESVYYSLNASVQPASADTLRSLSEGERTGEVLELYSDKVLKVTDPMQSTISDYVRNYRGHDWKVVSSEFWDEFGSHYNVLVRLKKNRDAIPAGATINELV